jgi:hypothetical protein
MQRTPTIAEELTDRIWTIKEPIAFRIPANDKSTRPQFDPRLIQYDILLAWRYEKLLMKVLCPITYV